MPCLHHSIDIGRGKDIQFQKNLIFMSELTHIFLCAVLKSLEIALQVHFSIEDTLAISECRNDLVLWTFQETIIYR